MTGVYTGVKSIHSYSMGNLNGKGLMYAVFTASLWGFLAIALKVAVTGLEPVQVVWFRFTTAFLILLAWTLIYRPSDLRIFLKPPVMLIFAALLLGLNYTCFISGVKFTSPSIAQVFIQIGPVGFALSGIIIFRETVNWKHLAGFALVITGFGLFYAEQMDLLGSGGEGFTKGILLIIGGGLAWSVFATLQKKLVARYSTNQLNIFIYGLNGLLLLPLAHPGDLGGLTAGNYLLLFYLGLNTVLAYGSLALAIKYTEANRVSVVITLNPVITFISMMILTHIGVSWIAPEKFTVTAIIGALIALGGALTVILAGRKKKAA